MKVPKILKNFNLQVNGIGHIGRCDTVTLPDLELTIEDHRGGGLDSPIPIDMGQEAMEMSFTLAEHNANIYKQWGKFGSSNTPLVFRGALADDEETVPMIVTAQGTMPSIPGADVEAGTKNGMEATLRLTYYKLQIDGEVLIEIDVRNMKRIIGGVDQLEAQRNAIQI